jgi:membrane protein implicated in regulation of membrane protease activity
MLHIIFLIAAVIGGTVMVCQFVLTLMGLGDDATDLTDGDFSGDVSHTGTMDATDVGIDHDTSFAHAGDMDYQHPDSTWLFGVLSFRTIVAAAAFFGVAGETALSAGHSPGIALTIAVLVGIAAMYGMYWLMSGISRLTSSGNERIGAALGKLATVYIPIPAKEKGLGKVHLTLQNRTVEFQAVSDEAAPLRTGETVEIVGVKNSDTVNVRRIRETVNA